MYRALAEFHFEHEYFDGAEHCRLSPLVLSSTQKLLDAMDWILIPQASGFYLMWNPERWSYNELREQFSEDVLIFILQPEDRDFFYRVTGGLVQNIQYQRMEDLAEEQRKVEVVCAALQLFTWNKTETELTVKSLPVDALRCITAVSEINSLATVNPADEWLEGSQHIWELYNYSRKISTIVCAIPIVDLIDSEAPPKKRLCFNSVNYYIKYYLMKLAPSERLSVTFDGASFKSGVEQLETEKPVQTFTSTRPIVLKQKLTSYPSLIETYHGRENILIDSLPLPRPDNLIKQYDVENNPAILAESFIN